MLFQKLGIADRDEAQDRAGEVAAWSAEKVASGEAEIALQQTSELLAVPGATLVGPIPLEVQHYIAYSGGVSAASRNSAAADALLLMLADPRTCRC